MNVWYQCATAVFLIFLVVACKNSSSKLINLDLVQVEDVAQSQINFQRLAAKILECAELQQGERVLLMMEPGPFSPMVNYLADGIQSNGAYFLGCLSVTAEQPEEWSTRFTAQTHGRSEEELRSALTEVDLGIMLPGASPAHTPYQVLQSLLNEGIRRTIHFHWSGAYDINGAPLEIDERKSLLYQQVVLQTDYDKLAARQSAFETAMRGAEIRVSTPLGTVISFEIGDRPVTKQDGDASAARTRKAKNLIDREIEIPAGAIRVAPIENSVNGIVAFPDAKWNNIPVTDLKMTFRNGKVADVRASEGADAVWAEIEKAGDAGRSFREFALGFNPLMPVQHGDKSWIPYYGYGAGIVRLSLGDNTELGGNVTGGYVRWNFFTDATVSVNGEVWVKNGNLIK